MGAFPSRTSVFFISAGFYFGGSRLLDVTGRFDPAELAAAGIPTDQISNIRLDVGGTTIAPNSDGSAEAGAIFHGKPSIASPNIVKQTPTSELDGLNKFLSKWKVYPVLSLKMTVKIGKN